MSLVIDLGKIMPAWRGEYDPATAYEAGDYTAYQGSTYVCIAPATGTAPTAGGRNAAWELFLSGLPEFTIEGEIVYRDATGLEALPPGPPGSVLVTRGAGAAPQWGLPASRPHASVLALPYTLAIGGSRRGGVIMNDHSLRAWGDGASGSLGIGTSRDYGVPAQVALPRTSAKPLKWIPSHDDIAKPI